MSEEIKKILSNMLHIIIKYSDDFDELEENEIRYQLPYKQMEKLYDYITSLQQKVEQLENIRKEAKEDINNHTELEHDGDDYGYMEWMNITEVSTQQFVDDLLNILNKGSESNVNTTN